MLIFSHQISLITNEDNYYVSKIWLLHEFYLETMNQKDWHFFMPSRHDFPLPDNSTSLQLNQTRAWKQLLSTYWMTASILAVNNAKLNPKVDWKSPQGLKDGVVIDSGIEVEQWKDKICPWGY